MTIMYDNEVMVSSQGMYNNKKSNFATQDIYYGPTNKKNDPCSTCPKAATCGYECKAFTSWADTGDYWNTDGWDTKTVIEKNKFGAKVYHTVNGKKVEKKVVVKFWHKSEVGVFKKTAKKVA